MSETLTRLTQIRARLHSISPRERDSTYGTPLRLITDDLPWLVEQVADLSGKADALSAAAKAEIDANDLLRIQCAQLGTRLTRLERLLLEPGEPDRPDDTLPT